MLTLIGQLALWRLSSSRQKSEVANKQAVKVTAHSVFANTGKYDVVQLINALGAKAVKKNWDIRTLVLELKDGDVVENVDIQQYIEDQLARGQGSWRRSDCAYGYDAPAIWENPQDQLEDADNHAYWVMRMTDLSYLLLQRWHGHLSNEQVEQAMAGLPPPEWNDPSSITRLFDSLLSLWHRVAEDRRAKSLLEDGMLTIIGQNKVYGPSLKGGTSGPGAKASEDSLH